MKYSERLIEVLGLVAAHKGEFVLDMDGSIRHKTHKSVCDNACPLLVLCLDQGRREATNGRFDLFEEYLGLESDEVALVTDAADARADNLVTADEVKMRRRLLKILGLKEE